MKHAQVQYAVMFAAVAITGICIKHLLRLNELSSFGIVMVKDIIVIALITYFFRACRKTDNPKKRQIFAAVLQLLLLVNIVVDIVFTRLHA
jgi:hypothetical protein